MVDVPYLSLFGNFTEDEKKAQKVNHVVIDYGSDERRLCLTVYIDGPDRDLFFEFDSRAFLQAIREAIKSDDLNEEVFHRKWFAQTYEGE